MEEVAAAVKAAADVTDAEAQARCVAVWPWRWLMTISHALDLFAAVHSAFMALVDGGDAPPASAKPPVKQIERGNSLSSIMRMLFRARRQFKPEVRWAGTRVASMRTGADR